MPQGQAPAQNPQPMQSSPFTTISNSRPPFSRLEIAPCGQMVMQMSHPRQEPQEEQAEAQ